MFNTDRNVSLLVTNYSINCFVSVTESSHAPQISVGKMINITAQAAVRCFYKICFEKYEITCLPKENPNICLNVGISCILEIQEYDNQRQEPRLQLLMLLNISSCFKIIYVKRKATLLNLIYILCND